MMVQGLLRSAATIAMVAGTYLPTAAFAQDASTAGTVGSEKPEGSDIVVTARKRDELQRNVPEAISVLTATNIERSGVKNIQDLPSQIPNFSIVKTQNPGTMFVNVRGIGQFRNSEPPIAVVIDGVQLTSPNQLNQELYDIQQIEVLRGPQGALYGRNAVAGALNIVTKAPSNDLEGKVIAGYGNGDDMRGQAVISGPLIKDALFARVAGSFRNFDGLIVGSTVAQPVDFVRDRNVRGRVLLDTSGPFTADFRASYSYVHSGSSFWATPVDGRGFFLDGQTNNFNFPVSSDVLGYGNRELQDYSMKLAYDLGDVTITSVTARSIVREFFKQDLDFTAAPVLGFNQSLKTKTLSEELRLSSNGSGAVQWAIGTYLLKTDRDVLTNLSGAPANFGCYFTNCGFAGIDFNQKLVPTGKLDTRDRNFAYAFFGNATYDLTQQLQLSFGLRYDADKRKQINGISGLVQRKTFDLIQPKVNVLWKATPSLSLFASWGKGFRSGGFNADATVRALYDAEEVSSFELDAKGTLFGGDFSVSAFHTDFTNRQDFIFIAGVQTILTTPKAKIDGVEFTYQSKRIAGFAAQVSGGFQDGSVASNPIGFSPAIVSLVGLPVGTNFSGNELPLVYRWNGTFSLDYVHKLHSDAEFFARANFAVKDGLHWDLSNQDRQDTLYLLDLRAGVRFGNVDLTLWMENALNRKYYNEVTTAEFTALPVDQMFPAEPRTYGLTVGVRF